MANMEKKDMEGIIRDLEMLSSPDYWIDMFRYSVRRENGGKDDEEKAGELARKMTVFYREKLESYKNRLDYPEKII